MKTILIILWIGFLGVIIWEGLDPKAMQKRYSKLSVKRIRLFDLVAAIITALTIWQLAK